VPHTYESYFFYHIILKVKITYFLLPLKTLALLESFKTKLSSAIMETPSVPEENMEELGEEDDKGW